MKFIHIIAAAAALACTSVFGQTTDTDHAAHHAGAASATAVSAAEGEVRKIDKEQGKVTLKHGPIASFEMPGMTMVFKVADPKMLDKVKEGDKVKFAAERVNGAITVTAIEPVQ